MGKTFYPYYLQGHDAVNNTDADNMKNVIALGNGYISNYSVEASVGSMPTANVTVDGLNLKSYVGTTGLASPAINTNYGIPVDGIEFSIPPAISGVLNDSAPNLDNETEGWSCLRPGDITMSLGTDGRAAEFEQLQAQMLHMIIPQEQRIFKAFQLTSLFLVPFLIDLVALMDMLEL